MLACACACPSQRRYVWLYEILNPSSNVPSLSLELPSPAMQAHAVAVTVTSQQWKGSHYKLVRVLRLHA